MTNQKSNTSNSRLKQDYIRLKKDPVPYISGKKKMIQFLFQIAHIERCKIFVWTAEPLPSNILEWHYVIRGPEDSLYAGGFYHGNSVSFIGKFFFRHSLCIIIGCLLFSKDFPFKPPSIYIYTPNGRFKTNKRLCLSISDFHPGESFLRLEYSIIWHHIHFQTHGTPHGRLVQYWRDFWVSCSRQHPHSAPMKVRPRKNDV